MLASSPPRTDLKLSFDAVFYYVTNVPESISFYRDALGIPMVSHDYVARFDLDGVLFELVPRPPGCVVPGSGNARLCFNVSNIQETVEHLHDRGIMTTGIKHQRGGRMAFFQDPDGNELCLWEYDQAEGPEAVVKAAEFHI